MKIDLSNPLIFNKIYLPLLDESKRYILLYGGRDSAKSYFAAQKVIIDTMMKSYSRFILVRKIFADIKDSQLQTIKDILKLWGILDLFKINENPIRITFIKNGNMILARGLDKEAKTKSIKDPTGVWYEEANEISYNEFIKTTTSLRGGIIQEILTFNPELETEWINNYFFPAKESYEKKDGKFNWVESTRKDAIILHTTYKDNAFCTLQSAEKLEDLKIDKDLNYYRIYTLGLWGGALEGVIFNNWKIIKEVPERARLVGYGLDWGFTNDPTAIIAVYLEEKKLILHEIEYAQGLSNLEIAEIMEAKGISKNDEIVADSAEPKSISYIFNQGYNIEAAIKGPDSIVHGIEKMKEFEIKITEQSRHLVHEFKNYRWKIDRAGKILNKPIDDWNHGIDAIRYVVLNKLTIKKTTMTGLIDVRL